MTLGISFAVALPGLIRYTMKAVGHLLRNHEGSGDLGAAVGELPVSYWWSHCGHRPSRCYRLWRCCVRKGLAYLSRGCVKA